ncbi:MAG: hypothetical protein HYY19_07215 [Candidatus Rokubacteria bacterium]|nr:hypothetical protein [Candidatus Rokubacteria bacterium]
MLRRGRLWRGGRAWAWLLLLGLVLPAPVALLDSFEAPLAPGIPDGDDDEPFASLASLADLSLQPLVAIPSSALDLPRHGERAALPEPGRPAPAVAALPTPSRSPPLL